MPVDQRVYAGKIWPILVQAALAKSKMTYGELAPRVGLFHRNLNLPLDVIARHCQRNGLPLLSVVVVNTDTGVPGLGFLDGDNVEDAFRRVYDFNRSTVKNPFALFTSTS
jgi:hypothetical protein